MATSKSTCHARSSSLPSKSHPLIASVEDQLHKLMRSSEAESFSPSNIVLCKNLAGLKDLFDCVDTLLQLPLAQKALCSEQQNKCVELESVLDGSLRLLDICGNMRDVFVHIKGCVQDLESSFRRRNCLESSLANEIEKYFISRKKVNKIVRKLCADNLKIVQKGINLALSHQDLELVALVGLLRQVEAASSTVFKSLLSFVISPRILSISKNWSLASKLIKSKRVACEEEEDNDEDDMMINLQKIDGALDAIVRNKSSKTIINTMQVHKAQKGLEAMESTLKEIEEGLESVFRSLVKSRVSLLNILNH